jgi:UDP-N-acetylglucosamine 4-epimerase
MSAYEQLLARLTATPKRWLVTGAAGFIASHLVEALLQHDQFVVGLDNFANGKRANLDDIQSLVTPGQWARFQFIEGDIQQPAICEAGCRGVDYILHQAMLGSVPRSLKDPVASHASNVTGILNMLLAARNQGVPRFVFASSSSVYGDAPALPKHEDRIGRPLSPYAATKQAAEIYAAVFHRCYGSETIGLRYFNVFGRRQDPDGPYAAVIPKWTAALLAQQSVHIHGDGTTSRDFCHVANVVQANILAATTTNPAAFGQVFNVAVHQRTSLNDLFALIRDHLKQRHPRVADARPVYGPARPGDVPHSLADITRARDILGYRPTHTLQTGLPETLGWYDRAG